MSLTDAPHSAQTNDLNTSSGRTSFVGVTVPDMLRSVPMRSALSSWMPHERQVEEHERELTRLQTGYGGGATGGIGVDVCRCVCAHGVERRVSHVQQEAVVLVRDRVHEDLISLSILLAELGTPFWVPSPWNNHWQADLTMDG
ncbi:hypothetical protein M422DRAFT_266696 [Sphaerobolus stellatus SS14]|uniref:Uncharacterized protein n=1 Tax=Sphaerobolus stellatus (strain SS14) TaxID=990650 RepID=A0A0C9V1U8_SPHS4|nr:hypothetical protein M422DRAFT_266696 [Sphaerobolus stellatus SS14]